MTFQSSLSGLNNSSVAMDVIGNNLANANVNGYKAAETHFSAAFAAAVAGTAGSSQFSGLGSGVAGIVRSFTLGDVTATGNALDMAIDGQGFFRLSDGGAVSYTRNGHFSLVGELDATGKTYTKAELDAQRLILVNEHGQHVTGYVADAAGQIDKSAPGDITIERAMDASETTSVKLKVNLDAAAKVPVDENGDPLAFDPRIGRTYNGAAPVKIFDADGAAHDLVTYFVKSGPNAWQLHATVDGAPAEVSGSLTFDAVGRLDPAQQSATVNYSGDFTAAVELDLSGSTQYGVPFGVNSLVQDGHAAGELSNVTVGEDGILHATFTNGQSREAGQLVLATFMNPGGLINMGNTQWTASLASGAEKLDTPNNTDTKKDPKALGLGALKGGAIEGSNVDVGSALLSLIEQQRSYQANAQSIKAQDQMLQTLGNIR